MSNTNNGVSAMQPLAMTWDDVVATAKNPGRGQGCEHSAGRPGNGHGPDCNSVPEPSAVVLIVIALAVLLVFRSRRGCFR